MICICSQAGNDYYDSSFVTETLRGIQNSDNTNQDINVLKNLLKDVATQVYVG